MAIAPVTPTTNLDRKNDPYVLDLADVREPSTTIRDSLRFPGPGMVASAFVDGITDAVRLPAGSEEGLDR